MLEHAQDTQEEHPKGGCPPGTTRELHKSCVRHRAVLVTASARVDDRLRAGSHGRRHPRTPRGSRSCPQSPASAITGLDMDCVARCGTEGWPSPHAHPLRNGDLEVEHSVPEHKAVVVVERVEGRSRTTPRHRPSYSSVPRSRPHARPTTQATVTNASIPMRSRRTMVGARRRAMAEALQAWPEKSIRAA